jgi:hypothetical protein
MERVAIRRTRCGLAGALAVCLAVGFAGLGARATAFAQQGSTGSGSGSVPESAPAAGQDKSPAAKSPESGQATGSQAGAQTVTHITPDQAKQLFALVDELMKFSSGETGLPIKSSVKRQLTTRAAVEAYLEEKFNDDQSAKRLERDEIVLKKFGLLDRDFELKPFLLALLKEQIEAYYDSKTKTVNLLDWVDVDDQKMVLAHELTHALQDQHSDLDKWDDQTPDDVSTDAAGDQDHLARDEMDTARDAVAEGQATAVMFDYMLKPMGKSLVKDPEISERLKDQMSTSENSPVMARAPLLLSESMIFPYRDGMSFEQDVWMDQGQTAAFAGALDRPPTSTWEIMNPRVYERKQIPAIPLLPNFHPLTDKLYQPYDIGQVGQLDLQILAQLFGGEAAASDLTPAWNGGIYWAGQLRSATTPADQDSTKSLGLFYLSAWKSAASANGFAKMYVDNLGRKYSNVHADTSAASTAPSNDGSEEQVFSTNEGPVVITTRGKLVFVAESFPLDMARKLASLILDAQGGGEMRMVSLPSSQAERAGSRAAVQPVFEPADLRSGRPALQPLSGDLVRFIDDCGVTKVEIDAANHIAHTISAH